MRIIRNIKVAIATIGLLALVNGCTKTNVDKGVFTEEQQVFLTKTDYGVYTTSQSTTFTPQDSQWVINKTDRESRLQRDNMSAYAHYTLSEEPQTGKNVTLIISSTGLTIPTKMGSFLVLKKESGKLWLWDSAKKAGHLIYWE